MPKIISGDPSYVKVSDVEKVLRNVCKHGDFCEWGSSEQDSPYFDQNTNE